MIHGYAGPALQSTVIGLMKLGSRFEFATGNRGQARSDFRATPVALAAAGSLFGGHRSAAGTSEPRGYAWSDSATIRAKC